MFLVEGDMMKHDSSLEISISYFKKTVQGFYVRSCFHAMNGVGNPRLQITSQILVPENSF